MKKLLSVLLLFFLVLGANAQVANQPSDLEICDDDYDGIAAFDLTITEPEILGAQNPSDFNITFYTNQTDAADGTNPIITPSAFYNSANPQAIYVRLEANSNGNFDTTVFAIIVIPLPVPATPTSLEFCDDDGDGFGEFTLTDKDAEISNGAPNVSITYYEALADTESGVFPIPSPYVNIVPFSQIVFTRVESDINGCYVIVELELIVLDGCPIIDTDPIDLFINEGDGDGSAIFDLTLNEA